MKITPKFTQELVQYHFRFEEETGKLYWRNPRASWIKAGDEAGSLKSNGRLVVRLYGRPKYVHHIIWLYVYGTWPKHQIEHIDGNPRNNRLDNLRDEPQLVNCGNQKKYKNNTTGHTGIYVDYRLAKSFYVQRTFNGKRYSGGSHATLEEALVALDQLTAKLNALGAHFTERHGK